MHNCRTTRDLMTELLMDGTSTPTQELLIDLRSCRDCRNEFEALKDTLSVTTSVIESVTPPEEYWSTYHQSLKQRLVASRAPVIVEHQASWFIRVLRTSVRVPVPVAAAVILLFGVILFFVARANEAKQPEPPTVVRVPVQVAVPQEKIVTRIIYRDRHRSVAPRKLNLTNNQSTLAQSQKTENTPTTLVGFKPLDQIKLTVIKGGTGNEK